MVCLQKNVTPQFCSRITVWMVAEDYRYRHRYVDDDYFQTKNIRTHTPAMAQALWAIGPPVVTVDGMKNKGWL